MCGRFNQHLSAKEWAEVCDVLRMNRYEREAHRSRYNVTPTQPVKAIRETLEGRSIVSLQWKLIPFSSKTQSIKFNTINAKAETLEKSDAWRTPFRYRRCIVPAAGFYEWPVRTSDHVFDRETIWIHPSENFSEIF